MSESTKSLLLLLLLICIPIGGCGKGESPQESALKSIQPNDAQRALREKKKESRKTDNKQRAREKAKKFVVLAGVFRDDGIAMSKEEWALAHRVEALYVDIWKKTTERGYGILTEEQRSARKKVKAECLERELEKSRERAYVETCVPLTAKQAAEERFVRQLKTDIRLEAVDILIGRISPAHIRADFLGDTASTKFLANADLTEDQMREIWSVGMHAKSAFDHLASLDADMAIDQWDRVRSAILRSTRPVIISQLTENQIAKLPPGSGVPAQLNDSDSVMPSSGPFVASLIEGIELSSVQLEGIELIEGQMSERESAVQEQWTALLTADQWLAGKNVHDAGMTEGMASAELAVVVRQAENWSKDQQANAESVGAEFKSIAGDTVAQLQQVLLPDQFERIPKSLDSLLMARAMEVARQAARTQLAKRPEQEATTVVLRGVLDLEKGNFSVPEMTRIRFVESQYCKLWERCETEIKALLTEEQNAISQRIYDEGKSVGQSPDQSNAVVRASLEMTDGQITRWNLLNQLREQIRREARSHIAGLIGPERVRLAGPASNALPHEVDIAPHDLLTLHDIDASIYYTLTLAEEAEIDAAVRRRLIDMLDKDIARQIKTTLENEL